MSRIDIWSRPRICFKSLPEAVTALQREGLFVPFFKRCNDVLHLLEANMVSHHLDTTLAHRVVQAGKVTVLIYGETGSGKSTLVKAIRGDDEEGSISATAIGTRVDELHCLPCGMQLRDTPGFRTPLPRNDEENKSGLFSWLREWVTWKQMLRTLHVRLTSIDPQERPYAFIYCHRVGSRVLPERVVELLRIPHMKLLPVFCVLTDVCNADDKDLEEIRGVWKAVRQTVGTNAKGDQVEIVECNSQSKQVWGNVFAQSGVKDLISSLIDSLEPVDIINLTQLRWFAVGRGGKSTGAVATDEPETEVDSRKRKRR